MELTNSNQALYSKKSLEYSKEMSMSKELSFSSTDLSSKNSESKLQSAVSYDFSYSESLHMESTRVAYENEEKMSEQDQLKKQLIEKIFERFNGGGNSNNSIPFFPLKTPEGSNETAQASFNPYSGMPAENYGGRLIEVSEQYYHKQTIDFNASLQIQTPNQSFEMEISISFTQEVYAERTTTYAISEEMFEDPLVVNFDEDRNPFEGLLLHFEFDLNKEKEDKKTEIEKLLEELLVWQKDGETDGKLLAVIDLNKEANYFGDVQEGFSYERSESYYSQTSVSFSASVDEGGSANAETIDVAV